jgi:hypothetical protein
VVAGRLVLSGCERHARDAEFQTYLEESLPESGRDRRAARASSRWMTTLTELRNREIADALIVAATG